MGKRDEALRPLDRALELSAQIPNPALRKQALDGIGRNQKYFLDDPPRLLTMKGETTQRPAPKDDLTPSFPVQIEGFRDPASKRKSARRRIGIS